MTPSPDQMEAVVLSSGCSDIQSVIDVMGGDLVSNMTPDGLEFIHWFVDTSPPDTLAAPQSIDK